MDFQMRFEERFLSEVVKSALLRKLIELKQGNMMILEYSAKFDELSKYGYATIDTVIKRNEKFIRGLRSKMAKAPMPHLRDPSNIVVEMAI